MKIVIDKAVVDASVNPSELPKLHRLFYFAYESRHVLIANPVDGFDDWLDNLDIGTRQCYESILQTSFRKAATLDANCSAVHIQQTNSSTWNCPVSILNLDDAITLLEQPLGLLVENAKNDAKFLRRMLRPSEARRFDEAQQKKWIEFLHGGGTDIVARMKDRGDRPETRLRTFAIFDSDRRHPDELDPAWVPRGAEKCAGFTFEVEAKRIFCDRYWRLNRRFIESYLPRSEIEMVSSIDINKVAAYFRMPQNARYHFNMKKGFRGDSKEGNAHRAKDLYSGVCVDDKKALHEGFGSNLADQYSNSNTEIFQWDEDALQEAQSALSRIMRLF